MNIDPVTRLYLNSPNKVGKFLQDAAKHYYNKNYNIISDEFYDIMRANLESRVPNHPALREFGAPVPTETEYIARLPYPMTTHDRLRNDTAALTEWVARHSGTYLVSEKLNGFCVLLINNDLYTRGNGVLGKEITHLIPNIAGIPASSSRLPATMGIRGELIIPRASTERIDKILPYTNLRQAVARTIHNEKPDRDILSYIEFVAYEIIHPSMQLTPEEQYKRLAKLGFKTAWHRVLSGPAEMTSEAVTDILRTRLRESPYEINHLVLHQNRSYPHLRAADNVMMLTRPEHAIAFKWVLTQNMAEVVVERVEWDVMINGYVKPTIFFTPVKMGEVTLSHIGGMNARYIEENRIGPGSIMTIVLQGDAISPHNQAVLKRSGYRGPYFPRDPNASFRLDEDNNYEWVPGTVYEWNETHTDIMIKGFSSKSTVARLEYFAKILNIPGLRNRTLTHLVAAGYDSIPKLFAMRPQDIVSIKGFNEKSAQELVSAIQEAKENVTCSRLMLASKFFTNIMKEYKLALILDAYPGILDRNIPSLIQLLRIRGITDATAYPFRNGISAFFQLVDEIGIPCRPDAKKPIDEGRRLYNLFVVFFEISDKDLESRITGLGGKTCKSITRNTNVVVAKDPEGKNEKLMRARELGIRIMTLEQFKEEYQL